MNKFILILLFLFGIFISGCSTHSKRAYTHNSYHAHKKPRTYSSSKSQYHTTMSKKAYKHPTMRSYVVRGIRYYPQDVKVGDRFNGNASWYGPDFHGKLTSNGERYNMYDNTAAHKTLPMNTVVKVTNRRNGLSTVVRINDRGPFVATRIIDLSNTAARKIKMIGHGTAPVTIEVLGFYDKHRKKVIKKSKPKKVYKPKPKAKPSTYALQIASFTNIEGALKVQEEHDNTDGYQTVIKDIQTDNGRLFKVYLKGFKTEEEVREYKANGAFTNSFIVKEN